MNPYKSKPLTIDLESVKSKEINNGHKYFYWQVHDNILYGELKKGYPNKIEDHFLQIIQIKEFVGMNTFFPIIDIAHIRQMTKKERDFGKSDLVKNSVGALALIVSTPISRIIGNLFIGLSKAACPTRLFTNFDDAYEWVCSMYEADLEYRICCVKNSTPQG